ncbi:GHKL domain-containing protein [bacterium]|nr:GHKL domain-containing protein [bacterium]MBU1920140.1 GHKL domain-containing protein [bacterium]
MTLHSRVLTYLIVLHVMILAAGIFVLMEHFRLWIILLEILVAASMFAGIYLIRGYRLHLTLLATGSEFIKEQDFTHTFGEVASSDLNKLVRLYNEMIRRLRNERLRSEEQQLFLEKIMKVSPSGLITLDISREVDMINPAALEFLNLREADVRGFRLGDLPTSLAAGLNSLDIDDTAVLGLSGGRRIKCTHSQFYDSGFLRSFYLLVELTKEIWKSEKEAYETLIRIFSHEVSSTVGATQSILQSTLTYADQLSAEDRAEFQTAVSVAVKRTQYLDRFMRGYADVVRLPNPSRSRADIEELIKRILYLIQPDCSERNIRFETAIEENYGKVSLDIAQFEQVLMNLLKNAMEAIDRNGLIRVELFRKYGKRCLAIEDDGPGLSEEVKARIFTPFFSTKKNGQGIGLTLVHEILSRHGFEFSFESIPGELTRFLIQFDR